MYVNEFSNSICFMHCKNIKIIYHNIKKLAKFIFDNKLLLLLNSHCFDRRQRERCNEFMVLSVPSNKPLRGP